MKARSNSNSADFTAKADPSSAEYSKKVAIPVMEAIDKLPVEYRELINDFGYVDVYRAWMRGWSPEKIRALTANGGRFKL